MSFNTVIWLKQELDKTISDARDSLDFYIEDSSDVSSADKTRKDLQQIANILLIADIKGGVFLLEEMLVVLDKLIVGEVRRRHEALDAIMRATLQLPDYLEYIQNGHEDVPIVLLPLLNDMRAVRDAPLLSDKVLVIPMLESDKPLYSSWKSSDEDSQKLAKALRPVLEKALLGIFVSKDIYNNLLMAGAVFLRLGKASSHPESKRLWWFGQGMAEALHARALDVSIASKFLLGRLDRQVKVLEQEGEDAFSIQIPTELVKNMLFYIASSSSGNATVDKIKSIYKLDEMIPAGSSVDAARANLRGSNVQIYESLGEAVLEDVDEIKERLEVYSFAENPDVEMLRSIIPRMRNLSETLAMLGQDRETQALKSQVINIEETLRGAEVLTRGELQEVANVLIDIEIGVKDFVQFQGIDEVDSGSSLPGHEFNKVFYAVIQETLADMGKIRGKINDYLEHHKNPEVLDRYSNFLRHVQGAMDMLHVDAVKQPLDIIINFVSAIENKTFEPDQLALEYFADGYVSIELYLESLQPRHEGQYEIIQRGLNSLVKINIPEIAEEQEDSVESESEEKVPEPTSQDEGEMVLETLEPVADKGLETDSLQTDSVQLMDLDSFDFSAGFENNESVKQEDHDESTGGEIEKLTSDHTLENKSVAESVSETTQKPPLLLEGLQVLPNDVDPEILEIFLEEISEEKESIDNHLKRWIADNNDKESLTTIRRSFHTLKGSGRLVGAEVLGEFSWALENLTNRLINGSLAPTVDIISTLEAANNVLPELVKGVEERSEPPEEASIIMRQTEVLSNGGDLKSTGDGTLISESNDVKSKKKATEETENKPHDVKSIFLEEAGTHLEFIKELVGKAREFGTLIKPEDPLRNAIQALNTGAISAEFNEIAEPFSLVERYLTVCHRAELPLEDEFLHHLDRLRTNTEEALLAIKEGKDMKRIDSAEIEQLEAILRAVENQEKQFKEDASVSEDSIEIEVIEMPDSIVNQDFSIDEVANSLDVDIEKDIDTGAETSATFDAELSEALMLPEEIDEELMEIFLEEAYEILDVCDGALGNWSNDITDMVQVKELQRQLHTLKGGARMAGIQTIGDLSHTLESLFNEIVEGKITGDKDVTDTVRFSFDHLSKMVDTISNEGKILAAVEAEEQIITLLRGEKLEPVADSVNDPLESGEPEDSIIQETEALSDNRRLMQKDTDSERVSKKKRKGKSKGKGKGKSKNKVKSKKEKTVSKAQKISSINQTSEAGYHQAKSSREQVRVNSDLLDDLVNHAGEVNVFHSRIEESVNHTNSCLDELQQTTMRLGEQLRRLETEAEAQMLSSLNRDEVFDPNDEHNNEKFDPLELDRYSKVQQFSKGLAESLSDLNSLETMVVENLKEIETLLTQKSRVSTELQEGLMRTRLVPFSSQVPRLSRIVRQTARQLGKEVELIIRGEDSELDRKLLESMIAPMEHLLRNAIAHGIEQPEDRRECGKTEKGHIEINIHRSGPEIQIEVSDDGAGINVEKVRDRAIGLEMMDDNTDLTKDELLQFIIESGFSTEDGVSQISGRGVGMDVVNTEIKKLNGGLRIASDLGKGTTFIVNLPFTLAINQSLLVQAGDDIFAIPVTSIYGVARLNTETIAQQLDSENPVIEYDGGEYQLRHLASMLHRAELHMNTSNEQLPLLLVNSGDHQVAFLVDEVFGNREIVVKPLGPPLNQLTDYSGATILGDGKVALILDMPGLIRTTAYGKLKSLSQVENIVEKKPLIMVVDDSITIRKVTSRMLERNHFEVITAKDGMDAAAQLQEITPDLMLLDVEMPRMDGFELATQIRSSALHKDLPIIIITSRTGEKHKKRAAEIGVNRYMGKPFQEEALLNEIDSLLREFDEAEVSNAN